MSDENRTDTHRPLPAPGRRLLCWILSLPGLVYFATRHGGTHLRSWALEGVYRRGRWRLSGDGAHPEVVRAIVGHVGAGRILELGCGTGRLVAALPPSTWRDYVGIDLAGSAVQVARERNIPQTTYLVADFEHELPAGPFDLVIAMESLYYVAPRSQTAFFRRLAGQIAPDGKLLATFANPHRSRHLIARLAAFFHCVERVPISGRREYLLFSRRAQT